LLFILLFKKHIQLIEKYKVKYYIGETTTAVLRISK